MSFWTRNSAAASRLSGGNRVIAMPIAELASSTSPIAAIRASDLATREPSTSPVVPSSPVRV